jgi:hypothetical protein
MAPRVIALMQSVREPLALPPEPIGLWKLPQ